MKSSLYMLLSMYVTTIEIWTDKNLPQKYKLQLIFFRCPCNLEIKSRSSKLAWTGRGQQRLKLCKVWKISLNTVWDIGLGHSFFPFQGWTGSVHWPSWIPRLSSLSLFHIHTHFSPRHLPYVMLFKHTCHSHTSISVRHSQKISSQISRKITVCLICLLVKQRHMLKMCTLALSCPNKQH